MKSNILFGVLISLIISNTNALLNTQDLSLCDPLLINLPQPLSVNGLAAMIIPPELAIIQMGLNIMQSSAQLVNSGSQTIINNVVSAVQKLGVLSTEISISELVLTEKYVWAQNKTTQQYSYVFQGFEGVQVITISTLQVGSVYNIINAGFTNGLSSLDSVTFDALTNTKQNMKTALISEAINDASSRASRLVNAVGYQISSLKSLTVSEPNIFVPGTSDIYSQFIQPTAATLALNNQNLIMQIQANLGYIIQTTSA